MSQGLNHIMHINFGRHEGFLHAAIKIDCNYLMMPGDWEDVLREKHQTASKSPGHSQALNETRRSWY